MSSPEDLLFTWTKEQLDAVVVAVQRALSDPTLRAASQRAVQAKIWHECPIVASLLHELRTAEEALRAHCLALTSRLVYQFHQYALDATLDRAGIANNGGATVNSPSLFEYACLDAKERLYLILQEYDWLKDFFRRYPIHFYENSFAFVNNIPDKSLLATVKVIGLGISGSMAASGLAKRGITVVGYDQRPEHGPKSVTSRYQNASWRAYDTAARLVNDAAYTFLAQHRQRINVTQSDNSVRVVETDRVQIVLGAAIQAALDSARHDGAALHFDCTRSDYTNHHDDTERSDIVALFCGAHTLRIFDTGLKTWSWPHCESQCNMWLRVQLSDQTGPFCTRGGEIGAERWHYTIHSARTDTTDLERVQWNQTSQYQSATLTQRLRPNDDDDTGSQEPVECVSSFQTRQSRLDAVLRHVRDSPHDDVRFDYIFTNAPRNEHNLSKRDACSDTIVLEGEYTVPLQMTSGATVSSSTSTAAASLLKEFSTELVVVGGDALVPPNPLAAYGATLACEAAASLVALATAVGHVNAILAAMDQFPHEPPTVGWANQLRELTTSLRWHYEARSRSETYFQFVQTLICNVYSLPPFDK